MKKKLLLVTLLLATTIAFADNYSRANNIVTDHDRNLQWQDDPYSKADRDAAEPDWKGGESTRAKNWYNAGTYCKNLSLSGGGWRLPSIAELKTIVDTSRRNPAIKPVFQNAIGLGTWSGTTYPDNTAQAWGIGFYSGGLHHCNKKNGRLKLIRCVRGDNGGSTPPSNTPPTAKAGADQTVIEGEMVTLDGSASSDADGSIEKYVWKKGTTVLSRQMSFDKVFSVGTHTITLTVTDNDGTSRSDSVNVTVKSVTAPTNNPPKAKAGADQSVTKGDVVILDGSASSDADGSIEKYVWKEGTNVLSRQMSFDKVFSVGTHTITLTVTDNDGATASDSMKVVVSDTSTPPPSGEDFSSDDFSSNTLADYSTSGIGSWRYDSANERAKVTTKGTAGFSFSRTLASPSAKGTFSFDVNPVQKNAATGVIELRLNQTANTYYKIVNRNGSKTGGITKYVNGTRVDAKWFGKGYAQGKNYKVTVTFSAGSTTVNAFGQTLTISSNKTSINVNSFTIKTKDQDANFDNISYK